jgi:hypothetical protein
VNTDPTLATFQEFEHLILKDTSIPHASMQIVQRAIRRAWDATRVAHGLPPVFNPPLPQSLLDTLPDDSSETKESDETPSDTPQSFSEDNW